jgi:hypothetical protein
MERDAAQEAIHVFGGQNARLLLGQFSALFPAQAATGACRRYRKHHRCLVQKSGPQQ